MVWLRKKPVKGGGFVYHIVYEVDDKVRYKSLGTDDKKLAEAIYKKFKADLTLKEFGIESGSAALTKNKNKKTLEDFIEEYSETRKHRRPNTQWIERGRAGWKLPSNSLHLCRETR